MAMLQSYSYVVKIIWVYLSYNAQNANKKMWGIVFYTLLQVCYIYTLRKVNIIWLCCLLRNSKVKDISTLRKDNFVFVSCFE